MMLVKCGTAKCSRFCGNTFYTFEVVGLHVLLFIPALYVQLRTCCTSVRCCKSQMTSGLAFFEIPVHCVGLKGEAGIPHDCVNMVSVHRKLSLTPIFRHFVPERGTATKGKSHVCKEKLSHSKRTVWTEEEKQLFLRGMAGVFCPLFRDWDV